MLILHFPIPSRFAEGSSPDYRGGRPKCSTYPRRMLFGPCKDIRTLLQGLSAAAQFDLYMLLLRHLSQFGGIQRRDL